MNKLLGKYKNGNVFTSIYEDGTKVRFTYDNDYRFEFAENMDVKICNYCDANCPYCHEGSSTKGKFGDIMNEKFIETLHPFQEIAIGGGDATSHPDLIPFLRKLKDLKVIANITVNQIHFEQKQELIKTLVEEGLIHGLGVSLVRVTDHFIQTVKQYPNAVIHVINGIVSETDLKKLSDNDLKMLVLGYKTLRRGNDFKESHSETITKNQKWLYNNINELKNHFKVISFDNLAIEQLDMKRFFTDAQWERVYMGEEGTNTFYIDMVERKFAQNSTAPFNERYQLLDDVNEMFNIIKQNALINA